MIDCTDNHQQPRIPYFTYAIAQLYGEAEGCMDTGGSMDLTIDSMDVL